MRPTTIVPPRIGTMLPCFGAVGDNFVDECEIGPLHWPSPANSIAGIAFKNPAGPPVVDAARRRSALFSHFPGLARLRQL